MCGGRAAAMASLLRPHCDSCGAVFVARGLRACVYSAKAWLVANTALFCDAAATGVGMALRMGVRKRPIVRE